MAAPRESTLIPISAATDGCAQPPTVGWLASRKSRWHLLAVRARAKRLLKERMLFDLLHRDKLVVEVDLDGVDLPRGWAIALAPASSR
jgi:hypothetical protein